MFAPQQFSSLLQKSGLSTLGVVVRASSPPAPAKIQTRLTENGRIWLELGRMGFAASPSGVGSVFEATHAVQLPLPKPEMGDFTVLIGSKTL